MRILVFSTDDFLPPAGGAETALWEIAHRNRQHTFTLICGRLERRRPSHQTVGNVQIHRIGIGSPRIDGVFLAVWGGVVALQMHRQERFDLVWAVLASYGAFAATVFRWLAHVPYLLTLQEGNNLTRGVRALPVFRQLYRAVFRSADGLQAISRYLLHWGFAMGFRKTKQAELIPNGIDTELFGAPISADAVAAERARYHVPADAFVITTVSRLVPKNGIGDIIGALPFLPSRFVAVIHGFGSLRSTLEQQVQLLGVADRVRFMGQLERERLPVALRAGDVFVRPSLTEGLGTAFLEAMASDVPVIATPVGGIVDFLHDGENGFFTLPHDPQVLARTIERVAALNASHRAAVIERAREMVFREYDWDVIARRMDVLFRRIATP
jgi:glycosyltransferase involved in cell wall biosynthesis